MPTCRSVGSPVIAKSPMKPSHHLVRGAQIDVLGLLVGHAQEAHADALVARHVVEGEHHRRQPALHVVGPAAVQAVALHAGRELLGMPGDDVKVTVEDDRRPLGRTDGRREHRQLAERVVLDVDLAPPASP